MFAPESGVKVFFTLSKYKQKSRHILVLVYLVKLLPGTKTSFDSS